ncbi:uncharacterized mitochondrial protein-like protein [Tanacetum coccineum]
MHDEFEMSMMGELNFFLGLQIKQMEDGIFFNQSKYIKEMLKKFGLEDSKPMKTPMSSDTKLTKDEECKSVDSTKYRGMIGSLLYLTTSRPDIMFSVCLCARFQEDPKTSHLEAVKRIFRYIKGTTHLGLWYPKGTGIETVVYADSDHAGDYVDRKSTSVKSSPRKLYKFIKCIYMLDHIPSAGDAEAFETDEAEPTRVPSPRWHTVRISIRPEAPMPFPSGEEVERILALPPPPPSLFILLLPPSTEERLVRYLAAPALPSSPLPIVPHPYGRLRASSPSTHHLLHPSPPLPPPPSSLHLPPQVPTSLPLPSSPLPPLPSLLFIPPPVDRREDIPEAELPPHKRLCLTALTSRYEVGESSTAAPRPTGGHRADYGFIGTMDAEIRSQRAEEVGYGIRDVWVDPTEAVEEVASTTLEGVNARVAELIAVQEQDTQDIYADSYSDAGLPYRLTGVTDEDIDYTGFITTGTVVSGIRNQTHADDREGAAKSVKRQLANHETLQNSTNGQGDESHNSDTRIRGTVRTPRECTHKDFLNCKPLSFKGTEGVVVLSQWFKKMESVFHIKTTVLWRTTKLSLELALLGKALKW